MRRMIPQKLIDWVKSIKNFIIQNGNTTEIGGNLEVDGASSSNTSMQSDVYESKSKVGDVKVLFAKFNPTGKEDNHFHLTNSTTKLDDSNGVSHTIDEIFEGGGLEVVEADGNIELVDKLIELGGQSGLIKPAYLIATNIVFSDSSTQDIKGYLQGIGGGGPTLNVFITSNSFLNISLNTGDYGTVKGVMTNYSYSLLIPTPALHFNGTLKSVDGQISWIEE